MKPLQHWKARLAVSVIMLILAFLGMVITDIHAGGGWVYWKWTVPIYAILAFWLSWYVKRENETVHSITLYQELAHWLGLIGTVFMVSYLVHVGTISRFVAGIFQLILLSFALFLAGIYIESTFILISIILGVFALFTAILIQYMYAFIIPIIIGGILITAVSIFLSRQKTEK